MLYYVFKFICCSFVAILRNKKFDEEDNDKKENEKELIDINVFNKENKDINNAYIRDNYDK